MDWFLYNKDLRHERVKDRKKGSDVQSLVKIYFIVWVVFTSFIISL